MDVGRVTWLHLRDYIPYRKNGARADGTAYRKGDQRGPAYYSLEVTPQLLDAHAREIALFAKAVEAGRFERRPSNYQCSRCKVTEACLRAFMGSLDAEAVKGLNVTEGDYEPEAIGG